MQDARLSTETQTCSSFLTYGIGFIQTLIMLPVQFREGEMMLAKLVRKLCLSGQELICGCK